MCRVRRPKGSKREFASEAAGYRGSVTSAEIGRCLYFVLLVLCFSRLHFFCVDFIHKDTEEETSNSASE